MNIELAIAIGIILGLAIGLLIGRNARRERDERIKELECELTVKQNVVEKLKKKGYDADSDDN